MDVGQITYKDSDYDQLVQMVHWAFSTSAKDFQIPGVLISPALNVFAFAFDALEIMTCDQCNMITALRPWSVKHHHNVITTTYLLDVIQIDSKFAIYSEFTILNKIYLVYVLIREIFHIFPRP